jgi:hypothetical protein
VHISQHPSQALSDFGFIQQYGELDTLLSPVDRTSVIRIKPAEILFTVSLEILFSILDTLLIHEFFDNLAPGAAGGCKQRYAHITSNNLELTKPSTSGGGPG